MIQTTLDTPQTEADALSLLSDRHQWSEVRRDGDTILFARPGVQRGQTEWRDCHADGLAAWLAAGAPAAVPLSIFAVWRLTPARLPALKRALAREGIETRGLQAWLRRQEDVECVDGVWQRTEPEL